MSDTSKRGFASMDEDKQREIASKGGHAAHEKGTAHEFTPEEAREAGRKGGETVSQDREHMAEIGREGGKHSHGGGRKKENREETEETTETEDIEDSSEETKTRGGTREQHAEAGRQSHKNKNKNK
ncbi:stress-induced acidophilic repeat motif-containing protein [Nostoc sp. PCC 7524]|jgi:general stress protein YciG|uniref:KGG domain-containing protein n=1 Tax=Nostoc sp. (strain ATCC 29411 / PCC 7524) TaxID=28072 RepID=UPI00029EEDDA|nr:KGG domain-containing protein [Nostoc sp. PCC 7524]AFY48134.1 stress-induced acidophilic repeat motif-containing protein [Nostoc sp. PCC 7524]